MDNCIIAVENSDDSRGCVDTIIIINNNNNNNDI